MLETARTTAVVGQPEPDLDAAEATAATIALAAVAGHAALAVAGLTYVGGVLATAL